MGRDYVRKRAINWLHLSDNKQRLFWAVEEHAMVYERICDCRVSDALEWHRLCKFSEAIVNY